jgi:hypothetical protein
VPGVIFSVTGSPIVTSGNLALALLTQAPGTFFAAPAGAVGTPIFRTIVSTDLPSPAVINITGNAATANSFTAAPTNCSAGSYTTGIDIFGNAQNCTVAATGGGSGTVTSFAVGTWPSWLTPTVTNATTTPSLAVAGGTVPVANGGTGATTTATARTGLGAAASGANGDITSLTGLTTALPISEGGTGATTAAAARTNLGVLGLNFLLFSATGGFNPASATTYYIGPVGAGFKTTTAGQLGYVMPTACTISTVNYYFYIQGTLDTAANNITLSLDKNAGTALADTSTTTASNLATNQISVTTSDAVVVGDVIRLKVVTPTFTTLPTTVAAGATIYCK